MRPRPPFPLLAKVSAWLLLHLALLALGFLLFLKWQLGLGLDSLMSGSAGERLQAFGNQVVEEILPLERDQWAAAVMRLANRKGLQASLLTDRRSAQHPGGIPDNVSSRLAETLPPRHPPAAPAPPHEPPDGRTRPPHRPPPGDMRPGRPPFDVADGQPAPGAELEHGFTPDARPVFLMRGDHGDAYWAGVAVHLPATSGRPRMPALLLIRSASIDGGGMFFDFKPWLWGGLMVLLMSLVFWAPFVWKISAYLKQLTAAADAIAAGRFQVEIPQRGHDELGMLGRSLQAMARRLDQMISGQKRFLGDAAHELCAPLARIRTGLGILETRLHGADASSLQSIDSDAAELAELVNELLAFSRAGRRDPVRKPVTLHALVADAAGREAGGGHVLLDVADDIVLLADPVLLGRAIGNLVRNALVHAGPDARIAITATSRNGTVVLTVVDDGPGVPEHELPRLFEPFYRVDQSRSRDSGGTGLGLAIVRTAIESCGGTVQAFLPANGGFGVRLELPLGTQPTTSLQA